MFVVLNDFDHHGSVLYGYSNLDSTCIDGCRFLAFRYCRKIRNVHNPYRVRCGGAQVNSRQQTSQERKASFRKVAYLSSEQRNRPRKVHCFKQVRKCCLFNPLAPNDIHMSYRTAKLQTLHYKYLLNKYTYRVF